jgi:hypothetical protein
MTAHALLPDPGDHYVPAYNRRRRRRRATLNLTGSRRHRRLRDLIIAYALVVTEVHPPAQSTGRGGGWIIW